MSYTQFSDDEAERIAFEHARGVYQRSLLRGAEAWSGATLRGKASQYGAHYARSRNGLLARLQSDLRLHVEERRGAHGRRELHISLVDPRVAELLESVRAGRAGALQVLEDLVLETHGEVALERFRMLAAKIR